MYHTGQSWGDGTFTYTYYCNNCGSQVGSAGHWITDGEEGGDRGDYWNNDGITTDGATHNCGGYGLGCGKTTSTIESATINFN